MWGLLFKSTGTLALLQLAMYLSLLVKLIVRIGYCLGEMFVCSSRDRSMLNWNGFGVGRRVMD